MSKKISEQQVETLAKEIVDFLCKYHLWIDVDVYYNNKMYTTYDPVTKKHSYNDIKNIMKIEKFDLYQQIEEDHRVFPEDEIPEKEDHILTMCYDSRLFELLHWGVYDTECIYNRIPEWEKEKIQEECEDWYEWKEEDQKRLEKELLLKYGEGSFESLMIRDFDNLFEKYGLYYYFLDSGWLTCECLEK